MGETEGKKVIQGVYVSMLPLWAMDTPLHWETLVYNVEYGTVSHTKQGSWATCPPSLIPPRLRTFLERSVLQPDPGHVERLEKPLRPNMPGAGSRRPLAGTGNIYGKPISLLYSLYILFLRHF